MYTMREPVLASGRRKWSKLTRDGILFTVGVAMLVSQSVVAAVGGKADQNIVGGAIMVLLSPLVLQAGDRRRQREDPDE